MGQELRMARPLLPDTDILVDFFRGRGKAVELVNAESHRIILSSIVVAELYAGVRGDSEQTALDNFVSLFHVVPVDAEIARAGGLCKRNYGKSHGVGIADAILAATADRENSELKTLNVKHYPMIAGLSPAYTK
jgi:predicted nucleic acid-binding protein